MNVKFEKSMEKGRGVVGYVAGRVDTHSATEFEAAVLAVLDEDMSWLVVDFARVNYISSAGLRSVLVIAKAAESSKCQLMLSGLEKEVYEIFEITGFHNLVPIHTDVETAMLAVA